MKQEKSIAPRFLNILEHYMTIVERENDELKIKVKQLELHLDEPYGDEQVSELKAEIKRLQKGNDYYYTLNRGVIAENDKLKEENNELKAECWCGCNDDLKADYEELKALVDDLKKDNAIQWLKVVNKNRLNERV